MTSTAAAQQRTLLVTGANKGIGFEVIKKLAQKSDNVILLGSRDLKRGQDALQQLGFPPKVHLIQLDTSSEESIARATDEIRQKYAGKLDVIINNAGILRWNDTAQTAQETMATNYYGIKTLNEYLIPLLRDNGRVVNVASGLGSKVLQCVSKDLQDKYVSSTLTTELLDQLVEDYISSLASENLEKSGYSIILPFMSYRISKAALIALTRVEARQHSSVKNISIYSVCPGFCDTDLINHSSGSRSAELGADSILYVVDTSDRELENGAFYQDGVKLPQVSTQQLDS